MRREELKDVAFLIIVRLDTIERLENTVHIANYLNNHFDTNIYLWEYACWNSGILKQLLPAGIKYEFHEDLDPIFHRTRYLNKMIDMVKTNFISVWDVDVIIHKKQIIRAVKRLREGVDVVYPYNHFYDTTDEIRRMYLSNGCNFDFLQNCIKYMKELYGPIPVGGAFLLRRTCYVESGKENENFYGWGYEDGDRYYRWINLEYKIDRINGPLFHLSHPRSFNSTILNTDQNIAKKRELFYTIRKKYE